MVKPLAVSLSSKESGAGLTFSLGIPSEVVVVVVAFVGGVLVVVEVVVFPPEVVVVVLVGVTVVEVPLPLPSSVVVVVDGVVVVDEVEVDVEYDSPKKVWERLLIVLRSPRVGVTEYICVPVI